MYQDPNNRRHWPIAPVPVNSTSTTHGTHGGPKAGHTRDHRTKDSRNAAGMSPAAALNG
jgi:hypothetical protein